MLRRLRRDLGPLRTFVRDGAPLSRVLRIRIGLSDRHDGGRAVAMLDFGRGRRIVYKPRACHGESIWHGALDWLNRTGFSTKFRVPWILPRRRYHWMEGFAPWPCPNEKAVRLFYFRWGAQAALAQMLGAEDLHHENWLAAGSNPILLDAEMLGSAASPIQEASPIPPLHPLLETGLLPLVETDGVGSYAGIAPFDPCCPESGRVKAWPRCHGRFYVPAEHVSELSRGFEACAEFVGGAGRSRAFKRHVARALSRFPDTRLLLRSTAQYCRMLAASFAAREMLMPGRRLHNLMARCSESALPEDFALAEASALFRGSIPRFSAARSPVRSQQLPVIFTEPEARTSVRLLRARLELGRGRGAASL